MDFVAQTNNKHEFPKNPKNLKNLNKPCNPHNPHTLNVNGVDRVYTLPGLSHCTPVKAFNQALEDSHSHLKASVGAVLKVLQVLEVHPKAHPQAREDSEVHPRAHLQVREDSEVPLQAREVKVLEVKEVNNLYLQAHPVMETVQALEVKDSEVNPNILLLHRGLQHRGLHRDLLLGLLHRGLQFSPLNQPQLLL